ncbi:hypothetical protein ElyMa_004376300 [Elysia marginata]|uniref:Uncharacterized protein n=1 Tax=Elysia marginata TaxID=1093978 RepID=A0AAV4H6I1_9GAST|nr:hypothetical protein ElyMa_004376300 [Elysia marginata]
MQAFETDSPAVSTGNSGPLSAQNTLLVSQAVSRISQFKELHFSALTNNLLPTHFILKVTLFCNKTVLLRIRVEQPNNFSSIKESISLSKMTGHHNLQILIPMDYALWESLAEKVYMGRWIPNPENEEANRNIAQKS